MNTLKKISKRSTNKPMQNSSNLGKSMQDKSLKKTSKGKNKELGLPFGKMRKVVIAFDVDGTLRNNEENRIIANEDIRTLVRILDKFKNIEIVVWSGSGELYARQIADKLHISQWVDKFASKLNHEAIKPDIAIDDIQDTAIGKLNLIVREK